jgi:hypothetical protein
MFRSSFQVLNPGRLPDDCQVVQPTLITSSALQTTHFQRRQLFSKSGIDLPLVK